MKNLSRTAIITFFILLTSKILGFTREIILAYKYGTSYINDAYAICTSLPAVLFSLFASGIAQSYIPTYTRVEEKKKSYFFSNVITTSFFASIVIVLICLMLDSQIVSVLAPGFDAKTQILTEKFVDVVVWYLPIYVIFNILCADAQAQESFIIVSICDYIVVNIIQIVGITISDEQHILLMPAGYVFSMFIATSVLIIYSKKHLNLTYFFTFDLHDEKLKLLISLAVPIGFSVMANQLNCVIDRMFASLIGSGITSSLEYANRIQSLFLTLTTTVFITVCFPRINKCFLQKDIAGGTYYIKKASMLTAFVAIPFMLLVMIYAIPIVRVLFERGAFDSNSTKITAECLSLYALGIPFYAFREVGSKGLAANMKQKVILKNTLFTVAVNIILNICLFRKFQHMGLAFSTSIAGMMCSVLVYFEIREMKIFQRDEIIELLKIFVCTSVSGILGYCIYGALVERNTMELITLTISILAFVAVYVGLSALLKVRILSWCINSLLKKK